MNHHRHLEEAELIAWLKSGEAAAYEYLYDHYSAALYGVITRIVIQKEKAEDVLQEVFIKIYNSMEGYEADKGRLFTWMIQIARNTAIDALRSRDFKNSRKNLELKTNVYLYETGSDERAKHDAMGMDKLIKELKDEHRRIIDLAYFKGLTQEEISSHLALPVGTVKSRVRSALMQLRKILKGSQL